MYLLEFLLFLLVLLGVAWLMISTGIVTVARKAKPKPPEKLGPETCGSCVNFDREAGQRVAAEHPIFMAATQAVAPWRMVATYDDEGNPTQQPSPEMLKTSWEDIGLCLVADNNGNRECVMATCVGCPKGAYTRRVDA